ncbi:hypothetical protein A2U01_0102323, partial [Trifolium medium]|nr:hypothetical protein [Trifolium medium]
MDSWREAATGSDLWRDISPGE